MSLIVKSGDIALIRTRTKLRMGRKANVHAKRRIHSGKKTALYAGEMHSFEILLLSLDENTTEEEIKERKKNCVIRPVFEKSC